MHSVLKRGIAASLALLVVAVSWGQSRTYLALGDSVAWGYQPNNVVRSAGDKGYVKLFADYLARYENGTRPRLINLAIPGETTGSYFDTSEIGGLLNSNYPILFRSSQSTVSGQRITQELNAGRTIPVVTFSLGANDLLDLLSATFLAQPFSTQLAQATAAIQAAETNFNGALATLRSRLPNATILVPGYYNPYAGVPNSPENAVAVLMIPQLNAMLRKVANRYGAQYVETASVFWGLETTLTWILEDDVHPRDPGYVKLSERVIRQFRNESASKPPVPSIVASRNP